MSMLARYKKGGIMELVKLIESSGEPKRSQLIDMVRAEDPEFATLVESKLFGYENLKSLSEGTLAEIIAASPPKVTATAIFGETPEFIKLCERCLGKHYNEYKSEKETLEGAPPSAASIESSRRKLVAEARKLEASGSIKLLNIGGVNEGESETPGALAGHTPSTPSGLAKAEDGIPSIESFKLEPPPPGLLGERFEMFIKTQLNIK